MVPTIQFSLETLSSQASPAKEHSDYARRELQKNLQDSLMR